MSANTRVALGYVSLVKWPRLINTRGFVLSEPSVGREFCFGLRVLFALDVVAGHFPVLKYATRNWQLASHTGKHTVQAVWYRDTYVRELCSFLMDKRREKEYLSRYYRLFFHKALSFRPDNVSYLFIFTILLVLL